MTPQQKTALKYQRRTEPGVDALAGQAAVCARSWPTSTPTSSRRALAERLRPVVDQAVEAVAERCNLHAGDARLLLAAKLAQLRADDEAYERVCARRGVLAL